MEKEFGLVREWSEHYYGKLYNYARCICKDPSDAEDIVNRTLNLAYKNLRKLRRVRKHEKELNCWMMRTARYYLLKKIYKGWESGEDIHARYKLQTPFDPAKVKKIIDEYYIK